MGGFSDLFRLVRWVSYLILLFLATQVLTTAWDAVEARRSQGSGSIVPAASGPGPASLVKSVSERKLDAALGAAVQKGIDLSNGTTAVYIKKLDSGDAASLEEDRVFPSASLFKVPVLVELLRQQSVGLVDMRSSVRLQQKHWADGSGVLQARIGESLTVRELADLMIGVSDNVAALALLDLVGTDNVNLTLQANGLVSTRLRIGWPARDWGGTPGENTTTAREMGILFERIVTGKILNERASQEAIRILSQKQRVEWLPADLPPNTRVAHKSGELEGVRHDAGVIYGPKGPFVVVVLTENIADYARAAQSIARISSAAYNYFGTGR